MENDHRSLVGKVYTESEYEGDKVNYGKKSTQKENIKAPMIVHIHGK